ncbi:MAG: DUF365 domain-containing protein [Rhabdochlamydiaceae bacterium]
MSSVNMGGSGNVSIDKGNKMLFYASKSGRKILGEATITIREYLRPEETILKYQDSLFLTIDELTAYTSSRGRSPRSKLLVFVLSKIRKFEPVLIFPKVVTMAGQILTKEQYDELLQRPAMISD